MNIRTAILKAADSIEQNPKMFDFHSMEYPDCDTPGCAVGWISFHLGHRENTIGSWSRRKVIDALGMTPGEFYNLMTKVSDYRWSNNAPKCAKALRLYADKYHPADNAIPESVMAIFNTEVCHVDIG